VLPSGEPSEGSVYQVIHQCCGLVVNETSEVTARPPNQPASRQVSHAVYLSGQPSVLPSAALTGRLPTSQPSGVPCSTPIGQSLNQISGQPSVLRSGTVVKESSGQPSGEVTGLLTSQPPGVPSSTPTDQSLGQPSYQVSH
jgi:hypothetical protein